MVLAGDHWLEVPLDHTDRSAGTVTVYARELRSVRNADEDRPYLLYLQGGPGMRAPLPGADAPAWVNWALDRYHVIMLDQRGTGRSTAVDRWRLPQVAGGTAREQADYLSHFRADAIVADAEALRRMLLGDVPWTVLGQSFGGFCTWTYLSFHPEGLAAALVTGGIPPTGTGGPDAVYERTHRAVARRVRELDSAHPRARAVLADVAEHVETHEEYLPTGERLTAARLQEVGATLGTTGGVDRLAHLADDAWSLPGRKLSDVFLAGVASLVSYAAQPLYALLHESIYADPGTTTGWSAARIRERLGIGEQGIVGSDGVRRLPLTGEMVYPHTVARDPSLAPLAEVAEALAWRVWDRPLYDRSVLAHNTVPVAARIYAEDMFVDPDLSQHTAERTGGVRVALDHGWQHDALRRGPTHLLDQLLALLPTSVHPQPLCTPNRGR